MALLEKATGSCMGPLAQRAKDEDPRRTDVRRLPLDLVLTPSQAGDRPFAEQLLGSSGASLADT